jgi:hypothetical protein
MLSNVQRQLIYTFTTTINRKERVKMMIQMVLRMHLNVEKDTA